MNRTTVQQLEIMIVRILLVAAAVYCTVMGVLTGNLNWWKASGGICAAAVLAYLFL